MEKIISKVDWKKLVKIGGCVLTGVMAFASAIGEQKQADHMAELEKRLSDLESK